MNSASPLRGDMPRRSFRSVCADALSWAMNKLHSPAMIREFEYVDPISDRTVYLSTGSRYSVLHVGGLKLFFDRVTGRFDGTCRSLEESVSDRLELLD
jgi:hypothetical protein